jgi:hypothetical protein
MDVEATSLLLLFSVIENMTAIKPLNTQAIKATLTHELQYKLACIT